MAFRKLDINIGLRNLRVPQFATEPDFVASVQAMSKTLMTGLNKIINQFDDVSAEIILEAMQPTFEKSQEYCPVQTGALKESGYLEITDFRGVDRVEIGYAKGGEPRYAVVVHEDVETPHAFPTRSKFLQAAMEEDESAMLGRIADGYSRFMTV